jgi:hypothetical protein
MNLNSNVKVVLYPAPQQFKLFKPFKLFKLFNENCAPCIVHRASHPAPHMGPPSSGA